MCTYVCFCNIWSSVVSYWSTRVFYIEFVKNCTKKNTRQRNRVVNSVFTYFVLREWRRHVFPRVLMDHLNVRNETNFRTQQSKVLLTGQQKGFCSLPFLHFVHRIQKQFLQINNISCPYLTYFEKIFSHTCINLPTYFTIKSVHTDVSA